MKKTVRVIYVVMALAIFSTVAISELTVTAQTEESLLVVKFAYAPSKIQKGEVWKIYLSVSDPAGNMNRVSFSIDESGGTRYRPTFMYLKKGMEKEFAGYFALHTSTPRDLHGVDITLTLSILDSKGNIRGTFAFPLGFDGKPSKPVPSEIEKQLNQRIGIIGIDLDIAD